MSKCGHRIAAGDEPRLACGDRQTYQIPDMGGGPSRREKIEDLYQAPIEEKELAAAISETKKKPKGNSPQGDRVVPLQAWETADTAGRRASQQSQHQDAKEEKNHRAVFEDQKEAAKIGESAKDHSSTIMRVQVAFLDDVLVQDGGYSVSKTKLNHVFYLINKKYPTEEYFYKSIADWPKMEHYLDPTEWQGLVCQFRSTTRGSTIHDKVVSRYHFLSMLKELEMTKVGRRTIEDQWDPNLPKHITTQDEPMLFEFEAAAVLSFYESSDSHVHYGRKFAQAGAQFAPSYISIKQAVHIVVEEILAEAASYQKREAAHTTHGLSTQEGMERMRKKKEMAEKRIKRKNIGNLGRMIGTKGSIKELILVLRDYLRITFQPTLDEVYYFEWTKTKEGPLMRRNAGWEFLYAMEGGEFVRPLQLMQRVSTLSKERPNFSFATAVPNARKVINTRTWEIREEEKTRYCLSKWLRAKTLHAVHVARFRDESELNTPQHRLLQERFGVEKAKLAAETALANRMELKRTAKSLVFPAMEERMRREAAERIHGESEHIELLDAMDGLQEPDDD